MVIEVVILFERPRCQAVRGTLSGGSGTVCTMDIRELTARVENISQIYASRFGITRDDDWQILKLQEEVGELTQAHLMRQGQARRKGLSPARRLERRIAGGDGQERCDVSRYAERNPLPDRSPNAMTRRVQRSRVRDNRSSCSARRTAARRLFTPSLA